jgi:DNA-binding NtrC family response regulator
LRLLLVEDNKDTLNYLYQMLTQGGHRVRTADCLSAALDEAAAGEFDLVLSDIELPDGSGLDLMRSFAGRGVLGIAMSGYGSEDDVNQSRAAGFTDHLIKPLDHRQIAETIRRVTAKDE